MDNLKNSNINQKFCKIKYQEIYRKIIHLSSLWIPILIYFAPRSLSLLVFAVLLIGDITIEYGSFRQHGQIRKYFNTIFGKILRRKERNRIRFVPSGSIYVLASAFICSLLFIKPIAVIAMTVMLISDSLAALVGSTTGQHKIYKQKSLEGTIAFFISAIIVNMLFEPIYHFTYTNVIACATATVLELFEDKLELDDNLATPLSIGIILTLTT